MWQLSDGYRSLTVSTECHLYCILSTFILLSTRRALGFSEQIQKSQKLNHLIIDPGPGDLYIGAVNRIFRYDSDLGLLNEVKTGPRKDNPACIYPFGGSTCNSAGNDVYDTKDIDDVNKILVLDKGHSRLITCGSVFQGTCQTFNLELTSNSSYRDDVIYFIAANDMDSSTVAILDNSALYVGVTYSSTEENADTRKGVPFVSSRQISGADIFKYTATDDLEKTGTYLFLSDVIQDSYLISYISGFGFDGYSYFFTTQRESPNSQKYTSKIAQICQNDRQFTSYVEMPLICQTDNITYNLITSAVLTKLGGDLASNLNIASTDYVIVATFVKSQASEGDDKSTQSAVCVYTMDSVREKFTKNQQNCFEGRQEKIGDQFSSTLKCTHLSGYTVPINYCGEKKLNSPLSGEVPLISASLITFVDEPSLTAVAIDIVQSRYTVAFIGTEAGHLKKVLLSSNHQSRQYSNIILDEGSPINKDMVFSNDRKHLYVMTEYKITKVATQECSTQMSCVTCLLAGDPYCGWCSLENKCSPIISCQHSDQFNRWLTSKSWCIGVTDYQPKLANIHHPQMVILSIISLPNGQNYKCVYKTANAEVVIDAHVSNGSGIKCSSPADQSGLWIKEGQDHLNATLAVRSLETKVDFLYTPFILYTCSEYVTCSQCTVSQFPCHWCLYGNQCHDVTANCIQNEGSIGIGQKDVCPRLLTSAFLLPSGVEQDIQIQARNLPYNQQYTCQLFQDNIKIVEVEATRTDSSEVVCTNLQHSLQGSDHYQLFELKVKWKNNFQVDRSVKNVTVYSCNNMAPDCTSCIVSPNKDYNCVWCPNGGCSYRDSCNNIILETKDCPQAAILSIEPTTFPIDGSTVITITGSNIGQNREDILGVTLADEPCIVIEYEISQKILCTTSKVNSVKKGKLCIEYMHKNTYLCAETNLEYKDPRLDSIFPIKGPNSGQTEITISGKSLDTGKHIQVMLGDVFCTITSKTDKTLMCIKDKGSNVATTTTAKEIKVTFDHAERIFHGKQFTFYPDPVVTMIKPLQTFKSGGCKVTIIGNNLDTSQNPTIVLIRNGKMTDPEKCNQEPEKLSCPYPPDPDMSTNRLKREASTYRISLDIDGVSCTQNISACFMDVSDEVLMYPDPIYYPFNGTEIPKDEQLVLRGNDLNRTCHEDEVTVLIGNKECKVDMVIVDKLVCTLPKEWHKQNNIPVKVEVIVGNVQFNLGKLAYSTDQVDQMIWIIISAVIGGGDLIFIIIIIINVYKPRVE